jgi:inhibitor of KinA sporulation pathway (predicted exonuclease)
MATAETKAPLIAEERRQRLIDFCVKFGLSRQRKYIGKMITSNWGSRDNVQLNLDCKYNNVAPLDIRMALNIKKLFAKTQKIKPQVGMRRALQLADLTQNGEHHRALDDAKNTLKLLAYALN